MDERQTWVTGIGAATPIGFDLPTIRQRLLGGESPAQVVVDRRAGEELHSPGCLLPTIPTPPSWNPAEFQALPRIDQATTWAAVKALDDAGINWQAGPLRIGLILGAGAEWLRFWETDTLNGGAAIFQGSDPECLVVRTADRLGFHGPTSTLAAACASANYALALGRQWIRRGLVDVCIAGGAEIASAAGRAAFHNLRALSRRTDDAPRASRPFDRDRDGFVMGEGAVLFVLEAGGTARRRGARPYAELAGFGASSDGFHLVLPSNDTEPMARAIRAALTDARIAPADLDYVNAHAPGTVVGDRAESRVLREVLGADTPRIPVSSTKSTTGHLLSAAAAIEALASIVALSEQAIPPTINLDNPDPECDLCHVHTSAIPARVDVVLSNSFGFGGNNTSIVLRRAA